MRHKPIQNRGPYELFTFCVEYPFSLLLWLTVLPCDKEQYSKKRCLVYPIPGMIFLTWVILSESTLRVLFIGLGLGLAIMTIFYYSLDKHTPPKWDIVIYVGGMIGALAWTYVLVNVLVDLLECTGTILNLNKTFMGLTILAVGASMPDAITTITLCKNSESIMAISGAYSGQFFALTVAFGLAMLKLTLKQGPQQFDLFNVDLIRENALNLIVIFTSICLLLLTIVYSSKTGFTMGRRFAWVLLVVYGLFITTAFVIGIRQAILTF